MGHERMADVQAAGLALQFAVVGKSPGNAIGTCLLFRSRKRALGPSSALRLAGCTMRSLGIFYPMFALAAADALLRFYILYVTAGASSLAFEPGWLYAVRRVLHSLIHLGYNHVIHRLTVFVLSSAALVCLWVLVGTHITSGAAT